MSSLEHPDQLYDRMIAQHTERLEQALITQAYRVERRTRRAIWAALGKRLRLFMAASRRVLVRMLCARCAELNQQRAPAPYHP